MANHKYVCSQCGKQVDLRLYPSNKDLICTMKSKALCFDCAFWLTELSNLRPNAYIISGGLWLWFPLKGKITKSIASAKDCKFAIDMTTRQVTCAKKYIYYGQIPDNIYKNYTDSLRFISFQSYFLISGHEKHKCMRKGCFDRYHCFWYDPSIAEPEGPWNTISPAHNIGDEQCVNFINKDTMYL